MTAARVVFCIVLLFGAIKTVDDKTDRDSLASAFMMALAVAALLISFNGG